MFECTLTIDSLLSKNVHGGRIWKGTLEPYTLAIVISQIGTLREKDRLIKDVFIDNKSHQVIVDVMNTDNMNL